MNLDRLIEQFLSGRSSREEIERRIDEDVWLIEPSDLTASVNAWTERILDDDNKYRVADIGALTVRALRQVDARSEGRVARVYARRLATLNADAATVGMFLAIVRRLLDDPQEELYTRGVLAACAFDSGDHGMAAGEATRLLERAREVGSKAAEAEALRLLAKAEAAGGKFEGALRLHAESVRLRALVAGDGDELMVVDPLSKFQLDHALTARAAADYEAALKHLEATRETALVERNARVAAFALSELGITWGLMGERPRGSRLLAEAAREARDIGMTASADRWSLLAGERQDATAIPHANLNARAAALLAEKPPRFELARIILAESLSAAKIEGNAEQDVDARMLLAQSYAIAGELVRAVMTAEQALVQIRKRHDAPKEMTALHFIGRVHLNAKEIARAEKTLEEAARLGEHAREHAKSIETRQAISAALNGIYEDLVHVHLVAWPEEDGSSRARRPAEALVMGERMRAFNFTAGVHLRRTVADAGSSALLEAYGNWRAAEVRVQVASERRLHVRGLLEENERSRERFIEASRGVLHDPSPIMTLQSAEQLSRCLLPDECLVDVLGTGTGMGMVRLDSDGTLTVGGKRCTRKERVSTLRRWLDQITLATRELSLRPGRTPSNEDTLAQAWAALKENITEPLCELLQRSTVPRRVFIVPNQELWAFPFVSLGELLPDTAVSVLPSAAMLAFRNQSKAPKGRRVSLLDPTGSLAWARAEVATLPEFDRIREPTWEGISEALETAEAFHFAGHGIFDEASPLASGIVLSSGAPADPLLDAERNGRALLTTARIMASFSLSRCRLAVLSGCSTGLARAHAANEFTSLPTAFLLAGARNVIASSWSVNDGATFLLMRELYAELGAGMSPSHALSSAIRMLRTMPRSRAVELFGSAVSLPRGDLPFATPMYLWPFQHCGFD